MAKSIYRPEEIVAKLRQVDVLNSQGTLMADAILQVAVALYVSVARRLVTKDHNVRTIV